MSPMGDREPDWHPDINDTWCVAARTLDQETKNAEIDAYLEKHGIDLNTLEFVAEQRAVRMILMGTPRAAVIRERAEAAERGEITREKAQMPIELNPTEQMAVHKATAMYMEAMIIGWRAHQIQPGDYPEWTGDGSDIRVPE